MMWGNGDWGGGTGVAMMVMMVLFWAVVVVVGIWAVRSVRNGRVALPGGGATASSAGSGTPRAEQLLAERFARGEIDEAQFRRSQTVLRSPDQDPSRTPDGS
ncbi:MAG: SHOCT domain-containing protein [Lapillicoccus sp.]